MHVATDNHFLATFTLQAKAQQTDHMKTISDFFYDNLNKTNQTVPNSTQVTFICGTKPDTYFMFLKVTAAGAQLRVDYLVKAPYVI